ncbi:hypothetical protein SAMN06265222_12728 [Neorhodopirellula lusitana]|uniref:Secreted protein n=1 Tax=Neorhodopirellula lusitana TaxID=445327 RepID=A0ABY1QU19_9BACT|nr:hypothetical protein SAMN06265222_12728 [Neorhodopirellula lusitana]
MRHETASVWLMLSIRFQRSKAAKASLQRIHRLQLTKRRCQGCITMTRVLCAARASVLRAGAPRVVTEPGRSRAAALKKLPGTTAPGISSGATP